MILHPCEFKGNMRICSWDPRVIVDCGCFECEACRRIFTETFAPAGPELTAVYDRKLRARRSTA